MEIQKLIHKHGLLRGLSRQTIKTYVYVVGKFLKSVRKDPHQVTQTDIKNFLFDKLEKGSPGNTINVYLNGLKFFFEIVLRRKLTVNIRYAKIPQHLPEFLTQEECQRFFSVIKNKKHKLMVTLLYSAGLRVSELLNLRVRNFQLSQNHGWVRSGKGGKDRVFILAEKLKEDLVDWINDNGLVADDFVFSNCSRKMSSQTVRLIIKKAARLAGISKNVHPHTLRHSFATHLLENGYAVTDVQPLLGHAKIETTLIYSHLAQPKLLNIQSPFDNL